jgi:glycine/D-amino acid oxidase-like deaminating enzyme/nitrite reductase/ring-hydroxylating ferredoxin subunit
MPLARNIPPWGARAVGDPRPELAGEVHADVAVIGAGITGVTLARLLEAGGRRVALIEADRICSGVTAHTTAKVTVLHGTIYQQLRSKFGEEATRVYAAANREGLEWVLDTVEHEQIDCSLRRRPAFTYAAEPGERSDVEKEAEAAAAAGTGAALTEEVPLPWPAHGAVTVPDQAEIDPVAYVGGLTAGFGEGVTVFEHSRVVSVSDGSPCRVRTERGGSVVCEQVVVATLAPLLDRSLGFARTSPERSYCVAAPAAETPPAGMFLSAGSPTRSLRSLPSDGGEMVIVGGEGHKVALTDSHEQRYRALEAFARDHFGSEPTHRWSAQDFVSVDGAPLVGAVNPLSKRVFMATGYGKWGFTNGTAAALTLERLLDGEETAWSEAFASNRMPVKALPKLIKESAEDGFHFFADRILKRPSGELGELSAGEGGIVAHEGRAVAGYRDEAGGLHAVSPVCTHLWCRLRFNDAERSWDCPCHGSRFSPDGEVLQGPAARPLQRYAVRGGSGESRGSS